MTDIQILLLGLLAVYVLFAWEFITVSIAWNEVMQNKHKRMKDDFNTMHKSYLKVVEDCNEKPIEDPTFCEMYNRIRKHRSDRNNRNAGISMVGSEVHNCTMQTTEPKRFNLSDTGEFYTSLEDKNIHTSINKGGGLVVTGISDK